MSLQRLSLVISICITLLFLPFTQDEALGACPDTPDVRIVGSSFEPDPASLKPIQDAYDYATVTAEISSPFTLQLVSGIYIEDLLLNGKAVVLDGGWNCGFTEKASPSSVFGKITITDGMLTAAALAEAPRVVSTDQTTFDRDGDGFTSIGSTSGSADDCNDNDFAINPGAVEICDGLDNNCDGQVDEGLTGTDADGDGYYAEDSCAAIADDCNDSNPGINPGAVEIPYDGIDQDCNGKDGYTAAEETCLNSSCHSTDHSLTQPTDTTCAVCHADQVSNILPGHYGDTVRTAGNNMAADAIIGCYSCHDQQSAEHNFGANVVMPKVYPDWVAGTLSCDTCHEDRASLHNTATAHNNRVIDSTCASCHTSDITVLPSPGTGSLVSAADVDALHRSDCTLCHNYGGTLLNRAIVLNAIQQGLNGTQVSCLNCHTDKAANHGNFDHPIEVGSNDLSYDAPGQLCNACHNDSQGALASWSDILVEHLSDCATCHDSTRQDVQNVIADAPSYGGYPIRCLACHADKDLTVHGNVDHVALNYVTRGTSFCLNCHDPGAADNATVDITHGGDCTLCHTTVPDLKTGVPAGGGDCVTCHTTTWLDLHRFNPPVHSSLVTTNGTDNCDSCHADALIDPSTHLDNCSNCHNSDGSLRSLAIGQSFTPGGNCQTCHSDTWEATHTINTPDHGFLVRVDSQTSCANCHSTQPLTDVGDPKVHNSCNSCHNADGSLVDRLDPALSLSVGGDCRTCHGDYFPNHSHHDSQANDVSYDAGADTSQSSQQGCADCHLDYDLTNGTSLGLGTWETILVEHDLDGTKDGSTNSCDNCHAYDGSSSAPLTEVQNAIASGNSATCATCHTDKVPDKDHGTPTSGKHDEHLVLPGTGCGTCHGSIPYFNSGTDANGDGLYNLSETDVCATCHQDGTGAAVAGVKTGWFDSAYAVDCNSCHAITPTTGNHTVHLTIADCGSCHDGAVQNTTVPEQHLDQNIDVYDAVPADLGYAADKTIGSVYDSCATSYCHSSVQGLVDPTDPPNYVASPTWGTTFGGTEATCTGCHNSGGHLGDAGSPLTTGSHAKHLNFRYDQDATCNACHFDWSYTGCTSCHGRQVKHADQKIDVEFKPTFPQSATSSSGSYSGDPAPQTPYGSCSALYCHSPGTKASAPYDDPNTTALSWGTANLPGDCTGCHNGDSNSAQAMATGSHGSHIANYDCAKCHARTVTDSRTLNSTTYAPKNYSYGQRYHVDGWVTVAFSGDIATGGSYAGAASPTVYRAPGSAAGACANTYCHSDGSSVSTAVIPDNTSPDWGAAAINCDGCHSYPPAYSSGSPKANSHVAHGAYSCDNCHYGTTTTGNTITDAAKHANQAFDIEAGSGVSFTYSFASGGGTCSNISCHGGSGAVWGTDADHSAFITVGTTGCGSCHSDPPPLVDDVNPKVHDTCLSCHDSATGALVGSAAGNPTPTDCTTCHTGTWRLLHPGQPDHTGIVTVGSTVCADCHDDTLVSGAATTHNGCSSCHDSNSGILLDIAAGQSAPGDCTTCHGGNVQNVHTNCTTCHSEPPSDNAHSEHDVLGFGTIQDVIPPNCNACHSGASHYDGTTQVSILSNFDDQSSGSPSFNVNDSTCSNTRCHGGKTTPSWSSGSINVDTQCTACHKWSETRTEYNDAASGEHKKHVYEEGLACTDCHSRSSLAIGDSGDTHFSNLLTTGFELDPGLTVGGSDITAVNGMGQPLELNWDNTSNTCNVRCHGKNHDSGDRW